MCETNRKVSRDLSPVVTSRDPSRKVSRDLSPVVTSRDPSRDLANKLVVTSPQS